MHYMELPASSFYLLFIYAAGQNPTTKIDAMAREDQVKLLKKCEISTLCNM